MTIREACYKIIEHNKTQIHKNPVQMHFMSHIYRNTYVIPAENLLEKASDELLNTNCNASIEHGVIVIY